MRKIHITMVTLQVEAMKETMITALQLNHKIKKKPHLKITASFVFMEIFFLNYKTFNAVM